MFPNLFELVSLKFFVNFLSIKNLMICPRRNSVSQHMGLITIFICFAPTMGLRIFCAFFFRAVSATTAAPFGQIKIKHLNA